MFPLPLTDIVPVLLHFAPVFSDRVWKHAMVLVVGAILSPEKRTVTAALRVMGLSEEKQFGKYHRVLSRAVWSSLALSRILLGLLVTLLLSADSPLPIVIDETLERRQGAKIRAKGVFRDAVHGWIVTKRLPRCFLDRGCNCWPPRAVSTVEWNHKTRPTPKISRRIRPR